MLAEPVEYVPYHCIASL